MTQQYLYPVVLDPPSPECKAEGGFNVADYSTRLVVAGKGEIDLAVKGIDDCLFEAPSDTVSSSTARPRRSPSRPTSSFASGVARGAHV